MPTLSRRHLVTTAAALPALAMPVAAATLAHEPDPIFAAIEKHRRARAETSAAWNHLSDFEQVFYFDHPARTVAELEAERDWHARELAATDATRRQDDIALDLLHTQPTTAAGAAALLSYYVDAVGTDKQFFPEFLDDDGNRADTADDDGTKTYPAYGWLLARNVARALAQMAVQS